MAQKIQLILKENGKKYKFLISYKIIHINILQEHHCPDYILGNVIMI